MITRSEKLLIALPEPTGALPKSAAAVQELMGGKFGEMSTLMNYTFQSFNMRGRKEIRPFYELIANIAAEEYGHIELVSYAITMLMSGATTRGKNPDDTPLASALDDPYTYHYQYSGQASVPFDSFGNPWTGNNVFTSGNLKLDLLHNFFLECGARANKMKTYEMCSDPTTRALTGYLLVRGGIHIVAYAKALEKLTGVEVGKLLPIPDMSNDKYDEARKLNEQGLHLKLYRYSTEDYTRLGEIWNGPHPEDGQPLVVVDGPPEGVPYPDFPAEPQVGAPYADPEMFKDIAKKMFGGNLNI